ncbi:methionine--tRNA ligase [Methanoplanus sp. FWC-SCC4]|uniref:Methionine--tRNA ligase n=1 Tax=Methanochimaera problematica TaxID=2609417 RepID=A0AA97I225_9EURY|nr:methionine--tRNA ligase [Methanoplanus sp. FWC-SCC4]WOF15795.1 methionine--tRNA ligase [Methanoplanus sp. FWC-SCC4]
MSDTPLLVTCGLPYTNGPCHIGHLRTYIPADFFVRYLRHCGEEVVFVCGSDNHGTPIVISAESEGITPREMSERYNDHFDNTFKRMEIEFDRFGMTDDPANHKRTKEIVQKLINNGYIYKKVISQSYCPACKMFLPDRYVEGICPHCGEKARGDECDQGCGKHLEPGEIKDPICKVCGGKAKLRDQEHYFFKLSEFSQFLEEFLPNLKGTSNARNYAAGWIKEGLHDWCITRTLDWGVKFPGNDDLVVYVWVDAPIGYMAFTEEWAEKTGGNWEQFWKGDSPIIHFIGQDIIYHHCVFWPAILKGSGYSTPKAVVASGMVKIDDKTFSKSRGYVVWTNEDYLDLGLPADYLRYYLLSYTSHTKELNFSWKEFQTRVNNELVDTVGNFFYRTLHFTSKKLGGIPELEAEPEIIAKIEKTIEEVETAVREYEFKSAVESVMALASYGNSYIQTNAPWKLIKEDENSAKQVLRNCVQLVKALTILLDPVIPEKAQESWELLGYTDSVKEHPIKDALEGFDFSELPKPKIMFEKIEDEKIEAYEITLNKRIEEAVKKEQKNKEEDNMITIDEFANVELKIAKVIEAEQIEGSKKLLKIQVDLGDEKRQIVSGIAQNYTPEELKDMSVVVVTNLKPAKLFGVESNGMILAAGEKAALLTTIKDVLPGTKVL